MTKKALPPAPPAESRRTIADGWEEYSHTYVGGNLTRLPSVRRQLEHAYRAGASEVVLLIRESPEDRELVERLGAECFRRSG